MPLAGVQSITLMPLTPFLSPPDLFLPHAAPSDLVSLQIADGQSSTLACSGGAVIALVSAVYGNLELRRPCLSESSYRQACTQHAAALRACAGSHLQALYSTCANPAHAILPCCCSVVHGWCSGQASCTVTASKRDFGNPCGDLAEYLRVTYQ